MTKRSHILKDNYISEQYLAGVVSSDSVFQFILHLNSSLALDIKLTKPVDLELPAGCTSFAHALHDNEDELKVQLLKNKNEGQFLFKNQATIDYILIFSGVNAASVYDKFLLLSKSIKNLSLVMPLEAKKLKNLDKYLH